jgi:hypothetical protein
LQANLQKAALGLTISPAASRCETIKRRSVYDPDDLVILMALPPVESKVPFPLKEIARTLPLGFFKRSSVRPLRSASE